MVIVSAKVGSVAISKAGRDKGKYFVILKVIDEKYVYIADGVLRKLIKPKKKQLKHLHVTPFMLKSIGEKLLEEKKVFDAELRSALINVNEIEKEK